MDLFQRFATDEDAEVNGTWIKGPGGDNEFLIARAGNRKFQREFQKEVEENQEILDGKDDAADKCSDQILARVMAKTVLLGWRGNVKFAEVDLPYSREAAEQKLLMKDFRKWVNTRSEEREHFRAKAAVAQGNA